MNNIFNLDNKFFTFMGKVADVIILNLLFIITSLPIVTIGASTTALYTVSLKHAEGKEPYIASTYFRAWIRNFKQSTIIWLIAMPVGFFLLFNLNIKTSGIFYLIMRIGMIIALIIYMMILLYAFPLLAKFENTVKQTIINAFLMSIRHFLTTCMMFGTSLFFIIVTIAYPNLFQPMIMFWYLFGFAIIFKLQAQIILPIFNKHIAAEEEAENEISEIETESEDELTLETDTH